MTKYTGDMLHSPDGYVALDLEMTGLSPKRDRIIEIGAVRVENGDVQAVFSRLINPGREIPERVTEITGITQADVRNAPYMEEILTELSDFIGDSDLLGHQILLDFSFLKRAFVNAGHAFEKNGIDTLKLARKYLPELPGRRLSELCAYYEIPLRAHRAADDALAAHNVYQKLRLSFDTPSNADAQKDFRAQPLVCSVKKESPAGRRQKERLLSLLRRHNLPVTVDVEHMSKNEISRLTDRILAEYGR